MYLPKHKKIIAKKPEKFLQAGHNLSTFYIVILLIMALGASNYLRICFNYLWTDWDLVCNFSTNHWCLFCQKTYPYPLKLETDDITKSDLKHLKLSVLWHIRYQNEQKKTSNASAALVITSGLVITVFFMLFGGKREMLLSRKMIVTNYEVGILGLLYSILTAHWWCK